MYPRALLVRELVGPALHLDKPGLTEHAAAAAAAARRVRTRILIDDFLGGFPGRFGAAVEHAPHEQIGHAPAPSRVIIGERGEYRAERRAAEASGHRSEGVGVGVTAPAHAGAPCAGVRGVRGADFGRDLRTVHRGYGRETRVGRGAACACELAAAGA